MTIEATLSKEQFIRLSILRHMQRKFFYFNAAIGASLSAYAIVQGPYELLLLAWIPLIVYLLPGLLGAFRQSTARDHPLFLPTRYEFSKKGVSIKNSQNEGYLEWQYIGNWKVMVQCYVLFLTAGSIVAFPQSAVPALQKAKLEALLDKYIEKI